MGCYLRVYAEDGTTLLGTLPEFNKCTVQEQFNDIGSISVDYPENAKDASLIDSAGAILAPVVDGVEQDDWYLLEDDSDDPAGSGGKAGRLISVVGRGVAALFEDAAVYPWDYTAYGAGTSGSLINKARTHDFAAATPGTIMLTLIARAQQRGALLNITTDFTAAHDSAGKAWPSTYTISYDVGQDYTKVLAGFAEAGWADFRMRKLTLSLYVPDTVMGVDHPNTVLRLGRDVTSGPRKRSRRTTRNAVLVMGDEGAMVEANVVYQGRRREGYDGRGGVTDVGTLTAVGQVEVNLLQNPAEGFTLVYSNAPGSPRPFTDYGLGDFIRYDQRRSGDNLRYVPMRVRSVARDFTPTGLSSVSVELNDIVVEFEVRYQRKVDALLNGSTSNSRAPKVTESRDKSVPKAPGSVSVSSAAYVTPDGATRASATVSWAAVTQNTDGTAFDDFGAYQVQIRVHGESHWRGILRTNATDVLFSNLPSGGMIDVSVSAVDFSNNVSDWAEVDNWPLGDDATAPPVPTAPQVTPYLGTLRIGWDGRGAQGQYVAPDLAAAAKAAGSALAAPDFANLNVYMSQADNFAITDAGVTKVGTIVGSGGAAIVTDLNPGQPYYFAFTSVDRLGNQSTRSAITPGVPVLIGSEDISPAALANSDHSGYFAADTGFTTGGTVITDGGAYSGKGRRGTSGQTLAGIGYTALKPGRYRATWVLKGAGLPADTIPPTKAAILNATGTAITSDGTRSIFLGDLSASPRSFSVRFTVSAAVNTLDLPVVVQAAVGSGSVEVLQAYVEPVSTMALAEITDAQIGNVAAGKLLAGSLTANVQVAGKFTTATINPDGTAVTTGPRVEINPFGIGAFDASGQTFGVGSNGAVSSSGAITSGGSITGATITGGIIRTATSGPRIVFDSTTYSSQARFFPGTNSVYTTENATNTPAIIKVINTADAGSTAIGGINVVSGLQNAGSPGGYQSILRIEQKVCRLGFANANGWQVLIGNDDNHAGDINIYSDNFVAQGNGTSAFCYIGPNMSISSGLGANRLKPALSASPVGMHIYSDSSSSATYMNDLFSGYSDCKAASFTVSSSITQKSDVEPHAFDALGALLKVEPVRYRRHRTHRFTGERTVNERVGVGFVAEHLREHLPHTVIEPYSDDYDLDADGNPTDLRGPGIDLMALTTTTVQAIQQLTERVAALEGSTS